MIYSRFFLLYWAMLIGVLRGKVLGGPARGLFDPREFS